MGKNILIVGASSGIGAALALQLNDGTNHLHLASRTESDVTGPNVHYQQIDVLEDFQLELPEQLDALVYCPGSINLKPFHRLNEDDFLTDFKVNHLGAVKVIQQALKALKKSKNASIVLFSTVAVQTGLTFHSSVASAKGAIEGLGKALAAELAPSIRVNIIAPSLTDTPLAERLLSSEDKKKANADRHPLKSIGTAEDMANTARFLLGDDSRWMTGQVISVDGGMGSLR
ncbi:SDR family oxidoreductase [Vicingaceae bacterium]|nr:SDR family oxidoreductase [Vicingaceae bacterium]MDB4061296.1 SDR family oxidoreductase [Vicingaceae bacterium]MDC1451910.1 SDR family oxidoreductase [Vicingaceae bacterium]